MMLATSTCETCSLGALQWNVKLSGECTYHSELKLFLGKISQFLGVLTLQNIHSPDEKSYKLFPEGFEDSEISALE